MARTLPRWMSGTLVFIASGSVLVLEILAGRVLAPYVGVSLNTFTGIIGVVLAGIALGAWLGGRLADRIDPRRLLPGALVLGGAAAVASVPLVRVFGAADVRPGPSAIVFLAAVGFFVPAVLLSAVTPLVIKIQLADPAHTGQVVGTLSALGTAGSLVGVFVTGYVLVAAFPTTPVVVGVGSVLVLIGLLVWLWSGRQLRSTVMAAGVVAASFASLGAVAIDDRCDVETTYFCARVRVDPRARDRSHPAARHPRALLRRHRRPDLSRALVRQHGGRRPERDDTGTPTRSTSSTSAGAGSRCPAISPPPGRGLGRSCSSSTAPWSSWARTSSASCSTTTSERSPVTPAPTPGWWPTTRPTS